MLSILDTTWTKTCPFCFEPLYDSVNSTIALHIFWDCLNDYCYFGFSYLLKPHLRKIPEDYRMYFYRKYRLSQRSGKAKRACTVMELFEQC